VTHDRLRGDLDPREFDLAVLPAALYLLAVLAVGMAVELCSIA